MAPKGKPVNVAKEPRTAEEAASQFGVPVGPRERERSSDQWNSVLGSIVLVIGFGSLFIEPDPRKSVCVGSYILIALGAMLIASVFVEPSLHIPGGESEVKFGTRLFNVRAVGVMSLGMLIILLAAFRLC